jgi:hypothetical protein
MRDHPILLFFQILVLRHRDMDRQCEEGTNLPLAGANIPDGLALNFASVDFEESESLCRGTSPDSTSYQMLAGFHYDNDLALHWLVPISGEARRFTSPNYRPQNTPIAVAGVARSPLGLTTVDATVSREPGDADQLGASGLVYTTARLTIDDEYLRDRLFRASLGPQRAGLFGGGHQKGSTAEFGATWAMNRSARLPFTHDQADLHGSGIAVEAPISGYSRGVDLVTRRLGL